MGDRFWNMTDTPWKYDTSSEDSLSVAFIGGGVGSLYLSNEFDGQKIMIPYKFAGLGKSAGSLPNLPSLSDSSVNDFSKGFINVQSMDDEGFSTARFPCIGYMLMLSGTLGVFVPSFVDAPGLSAGFVLFGFKPFASTAIWGRFRSVLPGAGGSWNICHFGEPVPQ